MKIKNIILAVFAGVLALTSCNQSLLDIPQKGVLNYETYYSTDEEILTASAAMYLEVRGWEYNVLLCKAMLTDDFYAGGAQRGDNANLQMLNEFTFDAEEDYVEAMFKTYYTLIYKANVILGHIDEEFSQTAKMARAEAKVFRAFAYFELISMWGNPPLVDHELLPSEYSRPNGTTEELWALVEKDLTEAIASGALPEKSGLNDNTTWRVTKQFAQALLGKAYLWQGKNKEAADAFDAVINSGKYALFTADDYGEILRVKNKFNTESIFESNRIHDDNNSGQNFSMYALMTNWRMDKLDWPADCPIMATGWGFRVPTQDLYDEFVKTEGADGYRLNQTIKTYEQIKDMGVTVKAGGSVQSDGYFCWKQRITKEDRGSGNAVSDWAYEANTMWMRYAEVLLCAAEAHLAAGNAGKATEYVNLVRARAKLAPLASVTLENIKTEKRLELVGEGQRFQDLLRWGDAEKKMKDNGTHYPTLYANGKVEYTPCNHPTHGFKTGKHERLPYPATEMRLNSEIVQNPGF
jgi:hypothetical protein